MNNTAKKLREAAEYIGDGETCSDTAIVTVREMFDVGRADTFGGDLGRVLVAIADELDELDDKAARRRSHIVRLESTIAERNRELRELRKQVPTEREREILDMWPRFEDSEYVWFGDEVACRGKACMLDDVKFVSDGTFHDETYLYVSNGLDVFEVTIAAGERVKRPARSVLDADGVEIKIGDTVYDTKGEGRIVKEVYFDDDEFHEHTVWCGEYKFGYRFVYVADQLTHTRPDSWERLEEDAESIRQIIACNFGDFSPSDFKQSGDSLQDRVSGLVRRAKALAGTEVE